MILPKITEQLKVLPILTEFAYFSQREQFLACKFMCVACHKSSMLIVRSHDKAQR